MFVCVSLFIYLFLIVRFLKFCILPLQAIAAMAWGTDSCPKV